MKKLIYSLFIISLLFVGCEKGLIATPDSKIKGTWVLRSATIFTNYRVLRNGGYVDSLVTEYLQPNVNKNLFYKTDVNADFYKIGDKWIFSDNILTLKSGVYDYKYLSSTNFVQFYIGHITNRSFEVQDISNNNLQLLSPSQSISINTKRYFILNFNK